MKAAITTTATGKVNTDRSGTNTSGTSIENAIITNTTTTTITTTITITDKFPAEPDVNSASHAGLKI